MKRAFAPLSAIGLIAACWMATAAAQAPIEPAAPVAHLGVPIAQPFLPATQPAPSKTPQPTLPLVLPEVEPESTDQALPINLATALRLADARPLTVQFAAATVEAEAGRLLQAQALWLPTLRVGADYQRHDGGIQGASGTFFYDNNKQQFLLGAGPSAFLALTEAIYEPLAERQMVRSRISDVQTAKNDSLLSVANAFFQVQYDRGFLAGTQAAIAEARNLEKQIAGLSKGPVSPIEIERVRAALFELEQTYASAKQAWRASSADLTRLLRLNPASVVVPLEPPSLTVTLVPSTQTVDTLIPIGLTNRPELASQQALVQATILRLKKEQMRPFIPTVVIQGASNPGDTLAGGYYGNGVGHLNNWTARSDFDVQLLWEFRNMGVGNLGLIREREGMKQQALIDLYRIQDQVAAEVVQAKALVDAALTRQAAAEKGLQAALKSYAGNLKGLHEIVRSGDLYVLVIRPQEALQALNQLQQSYINYYSTIAEYNRAEFALFRALGYPAQDLACGEQMGSQAPVDLNRNPPLGAVTTPNCTGCPGH